MTDAAETVIPFTPRPPPAPLVSCELRLGGDYAIEMTVYDDTGAIAAVLEFNLASSPEGFALDRLRDAWSRWRSASSVVA